MPELWNRYSLHEGKSFQSGLLRQGNAGAEGEEETVLRLMGMTS
jgi:hypothetical protein